MTGARRLAILQFAHNFLMSRPGTKRGRHGPRSPEFRLKLSLALKGKTKGRPKTEQCKRLLSEAAKRQWARMRDIMCKRMQGVPKPAEATKRMGERMKRYYAEMTPEERQTFSERQRQRALKRSREDLRAQAAMAREVKKRKQKLKEQNGG